MQMCLRILVILFLALVSNSVFAEQGKPLCAEEQAALRWLEHVTGSLSADEEKEWWGVGGQQFGLFSRRYNIAFSGYAAAAL